MPLVSNLLPFLPSINPAILCSKDFMCFSLNYAFMWCSTVRYEAKFLSVSAIYKFVTSSRTAKKCPASYEMLFIKIMVAGSKNG